MLNLTGSNEGVIEEKIKKMEVVVDEKRYQLLKGGMTTLILVSQSPLPSLG